MGAETQALETLENFDLASGLGVVQARSTAANEQPRILWYGADTKMPAAGNGVQSKVQQLRTAVDMLLPEVALRHGLDGQGLTDLQVENASVVAAAKTGQAEAGLSVVKVKQRIDGIEVFGRGLNLLFDARQRLVASSGEVDRFKSLPGKNKASPFQLSAEEAGEKAREDLYSLGDLPLQSQRQHKIYYPLAGQARAAWYVELIAGEAGEHAYAWVVDAVDGSLLFRKNLVAYDSYAYRVFADAGDQHLPWDSPMGKALSPHPTGNVDDHVAEVVQAPNLVILQNGPISSNDPWLAPAAVETKGNNVDAYADRFAPDGFTNGSDQRGQITAPLEFDYHYQTASAVDTTNNINAAIVNLFYVNNYLHDWFYDVGFDEVAGNAQANNYARGGISGDPLLAEGLDFGGFNNANMMTPADGGSPRMQMYLWDAETSSLTISGIGTVQARGAEFGPAEFNRSGQVVEVNDGVGTANDGCSAFVNAAAISGKVALIERGNCNFSLKANNAEDAGAIAMVVVNNSGSAFFMGDGQDGFVSIPSLMISTDDGAALRSELGLGTVSVTLKRNSEVRDGTIDNAIVAHEWGHYLTNRLIGNGAGLSNNQGNSLGEGWSDFIALLLMVREEDQFVPGNDLFQGVYNDGGYAVNSYYFGIRRVPYSTDFSKNALTFRHIEDGVSLPLTHPVDGSVSGVNNSEVHNSGEVWATMLWEAYSRLLNRSDLSFAEANERMRRYLVAGLKMTPNAPTYTEARDALLAAAAAGDSEDYDLFVAAFARRGMGLDAVAPASGSSSHSGVVEDFDPDSLGIKLTKLEVDYLYDDNGRGFCDLDQAWDEGETVKLVFTFSAANADTMVGLPVSIHSTDDISFSNNGKLVAGLTAGTLRFISEATLGSASQAQVLELQLDIDGGGSFPQEVSVNYDLQAFRTFDDISSELASLGDMKASISAVSAAAETWSVDRGGQAYAAAFGQSGTQMLWARDHALESDNLLLLPAVDVAATGEFRLSFFHAYDFENSTESGELVRWDGGVIEISIDGGAFVDVTAAGGVFNVGYDGEIADNNEALAGRPAFSGRRSGNEVLRFASGTLNGKRVQIRFRVGTDQAVGDPDYAGWFVDDLSFSGIDSLPFSRVVDNSGICASEPIISATAPDSVNEGQSLLVSASLLSGADKHLSFQWQQVSGPDLGPLGQAQQLKLTAPQVSGRAEIVLRVNALAAGVLSGPEVEVSVQINDVGGNANNGADGGSSGGGGGALALTYLLMLTALMALANRRQRRGWGRSS